MDLWEIERRRMDIITDMKNTTADNYLEKRKNISESDLRPTFQRLLLRLLREEFEPEILQQKIF